MDHGIPPHALAANWDPDILAEYMASVERSRAENGGVDALSGDESMSTGSDSDDNDLSDAPSSPPSSHPSVFANMRPADITSDDDAFSSDDEFATDTHRTTQLVRRALVLGRPSTHILAAHPKELIDMHEQYMRQLDCADDELAELKHVPSVQLARREIVSGYTPPVTLDGNPEDVVRELRMRSRKEIVETPRDDLLRGLVLLAQAQFRKDREIKSIYGPIKGDDEDYEGDISIG